MEKITFTLPTWALAAVAPFMAKQNVRYYRYYLNAAYVAPMPKGGCVVVATDGHALAVVRLRGVNVPGPVLLPRYAVEWAVKAKGESIGFDPVGDSGREWIVTAGGASRRVQEIDGRFPDWQAVIPMGAKELAPIAFDAALIERVVKSANVLRKAHVIKKGAAVVPDMRGERAALWACNGYLQDGVAVSWVLMPLRGEVESVDVTE